MHYVYILDSLSTSDRHYVGMTTDPARRLDEHNSGKSIHTNKFKPWKLTVSVGFAEKNKAVAFEQYLKTGSGRAFAKRHF